MSEKNQINEVENIPFKKKVFDNFNPIFYRKKATRFRVAFEGKLLLVELFHIKSISVHDFNPSVYKVTNEFFFVVILGIHFRIRS